MKEKQYNDGGRYTQLRSAVKMAVRDGIIEASHAIVYWSLLDFRFQGNEEPSSGDLAMDTGYSKPQIKRLVKGLRDAGIIGRTDSGPQTVLTKCLLLANESKEKSFTMKDMAEEKKEKLDRRKIVSSAKKPDSALCTQDAAEKAVAVVVESSGGTLEDYEIDADEINRMFRGAGSELREDLASTWG